MDNNFRDIYSISRLTREVRTVLESGFPLLWIEGEISNLAIPTSGHWYFTLKDQATQIRCAMFRNKNRLLNITPENGKKIVIRARISFYEARGEFQCIVEHIELAGEGLLQKSFDELKNKLNNEGIFNTEYKRAIPRLSHCIGVISSPTGAAIHDILTTLKRRYPVQKVIIYPVLVQGINAAAQITQAINLAKKRNECDCLILSRGGGSLEDLWPFNEETVARAIFKSKIPIVSGIGHEVDVTIADYVADHRAPTPTAAAEFVSPDQNQITEKLNKTFSQLSRTMLQAINKKREKTKLFQSQLIHPGHYLQNITQRLDELNLRMNSRYTQYLAIHSNKLHYLKNRLDLNLPSKRINQLKIKQKFLTQQLKMAWKNRYLQIKHQSSILARALNTVSPLSTLNRGYAIAKSTDNNKIIRSYTEIKINSKIKITLAKGELTCHVEKSENN
ncbi:Exodeoxyribonuclease VII large subunit [hydrothermal vent metagenome]|uniref:Exodeoxyribonuclease VII large subunit n=1 Tax=hydrothermal vent metagenome TaxID=652676 RepID=A0A3B1AJP5_9ZZZZ